MKLNSEIKRTNPDIVVYKPKSEDGSTFDTGNEHFLVFEMPDGNLGAIWTQSSYEGSSDQRIVFSTSKDIFNWTKPKIIAGERKMASWGFPIVSKKGRIYVIYSSHTGKFDTFFHTTGEMTGIYSDDCGKTWSEPSILKYRDNGKNLLHPISPCPIYSIDIEKGRYILFFHNNDGYFEKYKPEDTEHNRRPVYITTGKYVQKSKQPIWFSEPKFLMDTEGIPLGPLKRTGLPLYGSFTIYKGKKILWYPDRKFFLLGKFIDRFIER